MTTHAYQKSRETLLRAFSARSEHIPVFSLALFNNRTLNKAVLFSAGLLLAVVYAPFLSEGRL